MAKYDFNIIVVGAGSAGLVSAYIAAATKARVALVEKHAMGGDCLNTGCVPSKALLRAARQASQLRSAGQLGISVGNVSIDFAQVMRHVQQSIKAIAPHDSVQRYSELGVECFQGEAQVTSPHTVMVNGKTLSARSIIIATGASPCLPDIPGIDVVRPLTSDTIWKLEGLPRRLLVAGGGPVGVELAQAFARLGSEVVIVERNERLLKREDSEVSAYLKNSLQQENIRILTGHELQRFELLGGKKFAVLKNGNEQTTLGFDEILVALGRKANVQGFGLEKLGIALDKQGRIEADPFMQTSVSSIYVCGDVTGPYQFTHVSAHQAWYASVNAMLAPFRKFAVDYRVIPWATFTDPEVARVGLNEDEAKEKGIPYEVTHYDLAGLDRAITDQSACGFVKVLTKPGKDTILGVLIVGEHASEMLPEFVLAMRHGLGLKKILGTIHVYPTLSEANKFIAGNWRKNHLPALALSFAQKFHQWRR